VLSYYTCYYVQTNKLHHYRNNYHRHHKNLKTQNLLTEDHGVWYNYFTRVGGRKQMLARQNKPSRFFFLSGSLPLHMTQVVKTLGSALLLSSRFRKYAHYIMTRQVISLVQNQLHKMIKLYNYYSLNLVSSINIHWLYVCIVLCYTPKYSYF